MAEKSKFTVLGPRKLSRPQFPNVPATTFTLTIMANAHRIASETLELPQ